MFDINLILKTRPWFQWLTDFKAILICKDAHIFIFLVFSECDLILKLNVEKLALATFPEKMKEVLKNLMRSIVKRRRTRCWDAFRLTQNNKKRAALGLKFHQGVQYNLLWLIGVVSSRAVGTRRRVRCTCTRDIDPTAPRWCGRRGTFGRRCCSRPVWARPRSSWTSPAPWAAAAARAAAAPAEAASPSRSSASPTTTPTEPRTGIWTRCPARTRPWWFCSRVAGRLRLRAARTRSSAGPPAFAPRFQILKNQNVMGEFWWTDYRLGLYFN